jgi:PAS domain-containing protein
VAWRGGVTAPAACAGGEDARLRRELAAAAGRFALLESRFPRSRVERRRRVESMSIEGAVIAKRLERCARGDKSELVGRVQAERGLQLIEERYGLAIRGVDDALWEWNLKKRPCVFFHALEEHARLCGPRALGSHRRVD